MIGIILFQPSIGGIVLFWIFIACKESSSLDGKATIPDVQNPPDECFLAGTDIAMANGYSKNIEEIQIGDVVRSWDFTSSQVVQQFVTDVLRGATNQVIEIHTESSVIDGVTGRHPFYVESQGEWIDAADLQMGDELLVINQGRIRTEKIQSIQVIEFSEPRRVYNFTVASPQHNYFAENILVHNKSLAEPEPLYFEFTEDGEPVDTFEVNVGDSEFTGVLWVDHTEVNPEAPLEFTVDWLTIVDTNLPGDVVDGCSVDVVSVPNEIIEIPLSCTINVEEDLVLRVVVDGPYELSEFIDVTIVSD